MASSQNDGARFDGASFGDASFVGSVPELYDRYMVPLIFEPYAVDIVARVSGAVGSVESSLLEIAAGTGVVTRAMAAGLPPSVSIIATDLNQAMLNHAESVGTTRPVTWRSADVMELPFPDASFDVVVCQFGVMFFPDRRAAYAEVARVLRPGGLFIFNTWDEIANNELPAVVEIALGTMFADDPPLFMSRTPHGYFDETTIRSDVAAAGFKDPIGFETLDARSRAATPDIPAKAFCLGTPLYNEIMARDANRLVEATEVCTRAIGDRFGATDVDAGIRGFVITVTR